MSIRKKILSGFITIFSIGLIIGIIALIGTRDLIYLSMRQNEFQKHGADVKNILNTHFTWRQELTESILMEKDFTGSLNPDNCALGKWMNDPASDGINDPEIHELLEKIKAPHAYIHNQAKELLNRRANGDNKEVIAEFTETLLPKTEEVIKILQQVESRYNTLLDEKSLEIVNSADRQSQITLILLTLSALISTLLATQITKSIMAPIRDLTQAADSIIFDGNLEIKLSHSVNDEIGKLTTSFQNLISETRKQAAVMEALADGDLSVTIITRSEKDVMNFALLKMIDKLNNMISRIAQSTETVSEEAIKISENAQSLAQGATQQASGVEELNSAISEVAAKTKENAEKADQAAGMAKKIKENAEKGRVQMDRMTQAVQDINEASQSISNVIQTINDIAFQTNILALNAAVEAARAGANGKGFAVVADEVRNLAAKSAVAAKDTEALIENAMEKSELGAKIAGETAVSLNEIVEGITQSARIVEEIANASEDQDSAITEINVGIEQVSEVIRLNTETAQSSADAGEEMKSRFLELKEVVSLFNLNR